jgi:hypothetical protein
MPTYPADAVAAGLLDGGLGELPCQVKAWRAALPVESIPFEDIRQSRREPVERGSRLDRSPIDLPPRSASPPLRSGREALAALLLGAR